MYRKCSRLGANLSSTFAYMRQAFCPCLLSHKTIHATLSLPQAIIMAFANSINPDETAHEPSHLGLRCLTFTLSTLHINFFLSDNLLKKKKKKKSRRNLASKELKS